MLTRTTKYCVSLLMVMVLAISFFSPFAMQVSAATGGDTNQVELAIDGEGSSAEDPGGGLDTADADSDTPSDGESATEDAPVPDEEIEYLNELAWPEGLRMMRGSNVVSWTIDRSVTRASNPSAGIFIEKPGDDPSRYMNLSSDYAYVSRVYIGGELSFCVEPATGSASGVSLPEVDPNTLFTFNQQRRIAEIMHYAKALGAESDTGMYFAGQVMIWEVANRAVDYTTMAHNGSFMNLYDGGIAGRFDSEYSAIKQAVLRHDLVPSFMKRFEGLAPEYTIPVSYFEGVKILGELTLEDTNGVVNEMAWPTNDPYFEFHVIDANHLRIKAKPAAANLTSSYLVGPVMKSTANIMEMLVVGDGPGGTQDIARCVVSSDPVPAFMRLKIGDGPGTEVSKTDAEGGFVIGSGDSPSTHYAAKVRVDESPGGFMNGQVVSLPYVFTTPGGYQLTEVHAPAYADPHVGYFMSGATIRFTVGGQDSEDWDGNVSSGGNDGQTDMGNVRQRGQVIIQKVDADDNYINHWNVYRDLTDISGATYTRSSANPSIDGRADSIYDIFDTFSHGADWYNNETTVNNGLKSPIVNPKAQGDATLAGAVFVIRVSEQNGPAADGRRGIYLANGQIAKGETFSYDADTDAITSLGKNDLVAGAIVAVIRTDEYGVARSEKNLELGIYECQEVRPSKGYQFPDYAPEGKVVVVDNHFTDELIDVNIHEFQYDNDAMKGHIEFTKVLEGTVTNNPNNTGSQRNARDIYFGIYLNSKAQAPRVNGDDVLDENGNLAGTYDNDTQLPGEYFVQRNLDADAPISFNTGTKDANGWDIWVKIDENGEASTESINPTDAFSYDQNVYNAYYKELYMVVKTNSNGFASTRDDSSIVWCAIGGYANGGGLLNDADCPLVDGTMPLPFGSYTVVEFNPYEGYEAIKSVTINIDERAAMDNSDGGYLTPGGGRVLRRPELGPHAKTGEIEQNGRFGAEWDMLGNCYPYDFEKEEPYEGDKENIVKDQIVRQRIQVVKVDNETFTESQAVAAYRHAMENYRAKLAQYQKELLAFEEEVKHNPDAVKPVAPMQPKIEDFNIRGIISDKALSGITTYTSEQLLEMGYIATGNTKFLLWHWYNDSAAAGEDNYPGKRDYSMIGNFAYGEWIIQSLQGTPIGTFANPWVTDLNGQFELQYPLVYGDYSLVEVAASYGMWLPDAINDLLEGIIDDLAGVTREQMEKYLADKAAFDTALAQYIRDLSDYHTALLALANNTKDRSYDELAKLSSITWNGKTHTRPVAPVEPLRPGHTGGNIDVENVIKDENGNPQPWIIDPETGDWYVDEYGNTYAPKYNLVSFSVEADDTPQLIDDVYLYNRFVSIFYENENQKGYVELYKEGHQLVGSETKEVTVGGKTYTVTLPVFESRPVSGTEYKVYARSDIVTPDQEVRHRAGDLVDTITCDGRGIAVSKPLYLGKYYIVESKASHGFIRDPKQYDFTLEYQGQSIRVFPERQFYYNIRQNVEFSVLKSREVAGEGLGATDLEKSTWVPANGIVFGLFAREDIMTYDGKVAIPAGSLVESITIEDGRGVSALDLPIGKYFLKELYTNEDLQLDETEYDIEFKYTADGYGNGETVIEVKLGEGATVKNYLKRGGVEIIKSDEDQPHGTEDAIYLAGAEFTIYDLTGTARAVIVTGKGGFGKVQNLPYGRYIMRETKSPEGWRLNESEWEIDINEHGIVVKFSITNKVDNPAVRVNKRDTGDKPLSGAVFEVWRCENPEVVEAYRKALAEYVSAMEAYADAFAEFEMVQKEAIKNGEEPPAPPIKPEKPKETAPIWKLYTGAKGTTPYRYTTGPDGSFTSGDLEDGLFRLVEISPPPSYRGVFDKEFTIVAEEMERPRILTFEAINFKEDPGPDYGKVTEDKPDKEYPKTGDEEEDTISETDIITTDGNRPTSHGFPETIKRDGVTYDLLEVDYVLLELPMEKTVEYTALATKEVPKTIEAAYGEQTFTLALADIEYAEAEPPETISHHEDFGYTASEPRAPQQISVFLDGEELLLQMASLEKAEDYGWRPLNIKVTFYGHSGMSGVALGGSAMPYSPSTPVLEGYEDAVLTYLGKDPSQIRIIGGRWLDEDFVLDENGRSVRNAIIVAEQNTARWVAHYGIPTDGKIEYDALATYRTGTTGEFKYEATAVYVARDKGSFPIIIFIIGAVLVGGAALGVVIYMRRREYAED